MQSLKEIGRRIRKLREEMKLTQEQLAHMVNYTSKSSVNKIEDGKVNLSQSKIKLFAEALNTTPAYLMGWGIKDNNSLTEHELKLIDAYRNANPITKQNIDMILGIKEN